MNLKAVAAFVVILMLIIVFAYFEIYNNPGNTPPVRIIGNKPIPGANGIANTTAPTNTISNVTSNKTTNSSSYINCISASPSVNIANGNFATGTYEGWNITGQGFLNSSGAAVPTNIIFANANGEYYGGPWTNYDGTYFASTYHGGISLSPGNLTSNTFEVVEPYLNFRIISTQSSLLYVELLENGRPYMVAHYDTLSATGNSTSQSVFVNETLPLLNLLCKDVSVRVSSGVVGSISTVRDYIAVGDFVQSKSDLTTPGTVLNTTLVGSAN